jgi:hypothetical protein
LRRAKQAQLIASGGARNARNFGCRLPACYP